MKHHLKCWPQYFQAVWVGVKDFEIRYNDRDFEVHDEIVLSEYDPKEDDYTGRIVEGVITYITNFNQKEKWVVFGYRITGQTE